MAGTRPSRGTRGMPVKDDIGRRHPPPTENYHDGDLRDSPALPSGVADDA
uniref:Uncharacterized protein n=1 Tax=Arundo donax TaxID=35708 RepID=A0A0A9E938_ARUDO